MLAQTPKKQFLLDCKYLHLQCPTSQLTTPTQNLPKQSPQLLQKINQYISYLNSSTIAIPTTPTPISADTKYTPSQLFAILTKMLQNNDIIGAIKLLEGSYRLYGNRSIFMYNIGWLYQKLGRNKKAVFWYERLLKEDGRKREIYVYSYVIGLLGEGRIQESFGVLQRYMADRGSNRFLLQQLFLKILAYRNNRNEIAHYLQHFFSNHSHPPITIYNLALLLKTHLPKKSHELFMKINQFVTNNSNYSLQFKLKIKINLLELELRNLEGFNDEEPIYNNCRNLLERKRELKMIKYRILELQEDIKQHVQITENFKCKIQTLKSQKQRSHNNLQLNKEQNFIQKLFTIKKTESQTLANHQSHPPAILSEEPSIRYHSQRKQNQQKLKFLMKKQKELNSFFRNINVYRENNSINVQILNKMVIGKDKGKSQGKGKEKGKNNGKSKRGEQNLTQQKINLDSPYYDELQKEFNKKKEKYRLEYKEEDVQEMIYQFLGDYEGEYGGKGNKGQNKNKFREKINIKIIQRFMDRLQKQKEKEKGKQNQKDHSKKETEKYKPIQTEFNIRLLEPKENKSVQKSCQTSKTASKPPSNITSNKDVIQGSSKFIKIFRGNDRLYTKFTRNQKKKPSIKPLDTLQKYQHYLQEAQSLESQNKFQAAHELYEKMYKIFKETAQKETILLKIARNFQKLNFTEEAEKTYKKCTKINNNFQAFYRLGCLLVKNGAIKEGIENLEKANCIQRHNLKIQIKLVHAYSILDETIDRALSLANSILDRNSNCLQALILTAKIFEKKGRIKDALQIGLAICTLKASPAFYHYVGLLYLQDSNINQAFKSFQLALQCNPEYIPSLIELATILSQTNTNQSIQLLKKTILIDQNNIIAYARLAKIYETINQDYESALEIYKKCLQIQTNYQSLIKIGDCYYKMNHNMDSLVCYNKALGLRKTSEVYQKIGLILEKQKQERKAIESYVHSLNQLKEHENSDQEQRKRLLLKVGALSINCNDYQGAILYLSEALDLQGSFQVYKMLGHACFGKGQYSQALTYFKEASLLTQQNNLQLLENIAMCFDKQQQYIVSKQIYQKILQSDPKNVKCLNNLANILLIMGKTNEAFYWFQFMLQQIPNNIDKRLRVADIYAAIGDWSKVEQHLLICAKQKENDIRVLERMVNLYKEKRDMKLVGKFQKKLAFFKQAKNN